MNPFIEIFDKDGEFRSLASIEAELIQTMILHTRSMSEAARRLGIGRSTLYRKLVTYELVRLNLPVTPTR